VGGHDGERPAVVSRWWAKWWVAVEKAYFGFREERDGGGSVGVCTAAGKRMGNLKKM
jgi:hypothetical protein